MNLTLGVLLHVVVLAIALALVGVSIGWVIVFAIASFIIDNLIMGGTGVMIAKDPELYERLKKVNNVK